MRRRPDYAIEQTSRHRRDVVPMTPSNRQDQPRRHRTRRGKRTLNAGPFVAFSGQSTQISTGSRNAGRISRSTHGSADGWSAGAASPRNADSRSSAIVLATVRRRAASIFVWTIASIFRVVIAAICLALALLQLYRRFLRFSPRDGARFAAGFARYGCGLRSLDFCEFRARRSRIDLGCKSGIHG